jgi:DNA-binding response OmpR family regulator
MNKNKILIIDDDVSFLDSMGSTLTLKGFDVIKAPSGESLFDILDNDKPDLILLDVKLPGKDGFELLKEVKSNDKFSHISVIMITGDVTVHIDKAFSYGCDDCVFKPINIDDLINRIGRLLK